MIHAPRLFAPLLAAATLVAALALPSGDAEAVEIYRSPDGLTHFSFTGYAQPYFRVVQNPCTFGEGGECVDRSVVPDGFGLTRIRLGFGGQNEGLGSYYIELAEQEGLIVPLEFRVAFDPLDGLSITMGRFRVPFSRQELTSESRLQLIDRAAFIKATPGRQLGLAIGLSTNLFGSSLPDDFLRIDAGLFNGESAKERGPINNIDEDFLVAGRLSFSPFGGIPYAEGDIRPLSERSQFLLSLGLSGNYNRRGEGNGEYDQVDLGADLALMWHGVSLYTEGFNYRRNYDNDESNADRSGVGWNLQAGFMVPVRYLREHLELAARVQAWDPEIAADGSRDDELLSNIAGSGPARGGAETASGTQAHRDYVVGANWYFRGHDLKLQANYTWRDEIEDWRRSRFEEGVPVDVDDNSFFLQLTYRF